MGETRDTQTTWISQLKQGNPEELKRGDLITWSAMSPTGPDTRNVGVLLQFKSYWKGYCLLSVLCQNKSVRDIYIKQWEIVSRARENR